MPNVIQERDVPEATLALSTMAEPDYVDLFTGSAPGAADQSAEEWARVALEGASPTARFIIWQVLCGLRLDTQPSPTRVAGWNIADSGDDWIRLEAASWFMSCEAVVRVEDDRLSVALLVHYDRGGAMIWPVLSIGHRRAMPGLLYHAVRRMSRRR